MPKKYSERFFESLSGIDIAFLKNHCRKSKPRMKIIEAIEKHRSGKDFHLPFRYSSYNLHRTPMSKFRAYVQKIYAENSWESIEKKLHDYAHDLHEKDLGRADEILSFFEKDKNHCLQMNRFCLHQWIEPHFILKQLKEELFYRRDYARLKRVIALDEFYESYFRANVEASDYINHLRYKYRFRNLNKLGEDLEKIKSFYYNKNLCLLNKEDIQIYLYSYYFYQDMKDELKKLIEEHFHELALNPYRNSSRDTFYSITFCERNIFIHDFEKAQRFYRDLHRKEIRDAEHNLYVYLFIGLSLYDMNFVKTLIPPYEPEKIENIRTVVLPLIAKYNLLTNDLHLAEFYIQQALKKIRQAKSDLYFINTYSVYFTLLFEKIEFEKIIHLYENISFRIQCGHALKSGLSDFEIRFYYTLANYYSRKISHPQCCKKLRIHLRHEMIKEDNFILLAMKKNLERLFLRDFKPDEALYARYKNICEKTEITERLHDLSIFTP